MNRFYLHVIFHIETKGLLYGRVFRGFSQFGQVFNIWYSSFNDVRAETELNEFVRGLIVKEYDRLCERHPDCDIRPASHTVVQIK